ncbi:calcium-binding protein [Sphingomonas sp. CCH5-D11]|uniref:calcium-binding protein n=1 Tax=Sphingomonas sp. CCH5-D11 TaxID=1768786 RepID=UPI0008297B27|nr:M10 family metallopeptidase C-terminal domain-containing protein [Sphingomonas sp. CCH5-D11]
MALFSGTSAADYYSGTDDIDVINGEDGNDRLFGGLGADRIYGGSGNDILTSGMALVDFFGAFLPARFDAAADQDRVDGGIGDDVIGGGYNDILLGGEGVDTLFLDLTAADQGVTLNFATQSSGGSARLGTGRIAGFERVGSIFGSAFDDVVRLGNLATGATLGDHVDGGDGNDVIDGRALGSAPGNGSSGGDVIVGGSYRLAGGAGDDQLFGSDFADRLQGGDGNDRLVSGLGRDTLLGGAGDDVIDLRAKGYSGFKDVDGGDGQDLVQVLGSRGSYKVFLTSEGRTVLYRDFGSYDEEYHLADVETVQFGKTAVSMADLLVAYRVGTDGADWIGPGQADRYGRTSTDGKDTLYGLAGNDVLDGGRGPDTYYGGEGADTFILNNAGDRIMDAEEADRVISSVSYSEAGGSSGVGQVELSGRADIDAFAPSSWVVRGNAGDNHLTGRGELEGGLGDDLLTGTYGTAVASYEHAARWVRVSLAVSGAQNTLGAGIDTLDQIRGLRGSQFDDLLIGGDGDDTIEGAGGSDRMRGGAGIDTLDYGHAAAGVRVDLALNGAAQDTGGAGMDTIWDFEFLFGSAHDDMLIGSDSTDGNYLRGRDGDDVLIGRGGLDTLEGGAGADLFVYDAIGTGDWIMDFGLGEDRIDVSAIDADANVAGDQAFRIVDAFTGAAGELVITQPLDSHGQIRADVDGDGQSDLTLLFYATIPDDIAARIIL